MSYSSLLTKERILDCAKKEFIEKGFINANIRNIAKEAKVTTGALYNHFGNKEKLFEAIVGEFAIEFMNLFEKEHNAVDEHFHLSDEKNQEHYSKGSFIVLDYFFSHKEEAELLFFKSAGTGYENYVDKMVEIEENSSLRELRKENFPLDKIGGLFVHVMSYSGIHNMLEVLKHDLTKEEAFEFMEKVQKFYYAGTMKILET